MESAKHAKRPSDVVRERVRELRAARGWSQTQVAERLAHFGAPMDRSVVTRIENPGSRVAGVDEVMAFALALDVAPVHLLTPNADDDQVEIGTVDVSAREARGWIRGEAPLPVDGVNEVAYRHQVPDSEARRPAWDPVVGATVEVVRDHAERIAAVAGDRTLAAELVDGLVQFLQGTHRALTLRPGETAHTRSETKDEQ